MARRPQGYILHNKVTHARLLPSSSAHSFAYPTIALLLSLSSLETHEIDLARGTLFGYGGLWGRVVGLRPEAYLHDYGGGSGRSINEKLKDVLVRFGQNADDLDNAWMMTMPSYLGFEGINPLTVYYCYNKLGILWSVVLEVHNTFGERHVYVLPIGPASEDANIPHGFDHAWTFPRQFHVSPFNDRSGFYSCAVVAPPYAPSSPIPSTPVSDAETLPKSRLPTVRIHLYTAHAPPQLKLTAVLRPTSLAPLTSPALLLALARQPLALLLSFPRIAYEAARLHYVRRLDVYARPEPRAIDAATELSAGPVGNVVQRYLPGAGAEGGLGTGGGVGWQPEGVLERYAHGLTERFLARRAREMGVDVALVSANPGYGTQIFLAGSSPEVRENDGSHGELNLEKLEEKQKQKRLEITFRTPRFFTLLFMCPSAPHALLLGRDTERMFAVSNDGLFCELFAPGSQEGAPATWLLDTLYRLSQKLRVLPVPAALLTFPSPLPRVHPLDTTFPPSRPSSLSTFVHTLRLLQIVLTLLTLLLLTHLEKSIFALFHARFVPGDEPWGAWGRAEVVWTLQTKERSSKGAEKDSEEADKREADGRLGSVRRQC